MYANLKTLEHSSELPRRLMTEAGIVVNPTPKHCYDQGWREVVKAPELEAGRVEIGRRLEYDSKLDAVVEVVDSVDAETYAADRAAAVKAETDALMAAMNAEVAALPVVLDLLARVKALEDAGKVVEREV